MVNFDQDAEPASCQVEISYWIAIIFDTHCTSGVVVQHMKYGAYVTGHERVTLNPKLLLWSQQAPNSS